MPYGILTHLIDVLGWTRLEMDKLIRLAGATALEVARRARRPRPQTRRGRIPPMSSDGHRSVLYSTAVAWTAIRIGTVQQRD